MNLDTVSTSGVNFFANSGKTAANLEQEGVALWQVAAAGRDEIERSTRWTKAFAGRRKDQRYYALVEDTIHPEFVYRYFALKDTAGEIRAIQPFFIIDQDLLTGTPSKVRNAASLVRRIWPRFLRMRTMMVGCAAGEGYLDADDEKCRFAVARSLAGAVEELARKFNAKLIVFKEFKAAERKALACLRDKGFARIPSMPMTRLRLDFASFDDYMQKALSSRTRSRLRRGFREAAAQADLEFRIVTDITPNIDEIYPLYLAVYDRSSMHFEKLTPEYLCQIGRTMSDTIKFFLILKEGKIVAFNMCTLKNREICSEYVGYDYQWAFTLQLYNMMFRNIVEWALVNGYENFCSTSLNYEPKYHFRHELDPLDLYVKHRTRPVNFIMKRALRYLEPTSRDPMLPRFANYKDLSGN